jgi:hypothetical protein
MPRFKPTDPSNDVRLVLDTNTAISGLLWGGAPSQLIDAAQDQKIELISSLALLAELDDVITRRKFIKQLFCVTPQTIEYLPPHSPGKPISSSQETLIFSTSNTSSTSPLSTPLTPFSKLAVSHQHR